MLKNIINFIVKIELFIINIIIKLKDFIIKILYTIVMLPIGILFALAMGYADSQIGKDTTIKKKEGKL